MEPMQGGMMQNKEVKAMKKRMPAVFSSDMARIRFQKNMMRLQGLEQEMMGTMMPMEQQKPMQNKQGSSRYGV
jgi:hypothetical protein